MALLAVSGLILAKTLAGGLLLSDVVPRTLRGVSWEASLTAGA